MFQKLRMMSLAASASALLLIAGCGSSGGSDDTGATAGTPATGATGTVSYAAKAMVDNVTDNVVVATYTELDARAAALLVAIQVLANNGPTEAEMDAAQAAWRATRQPWEVSEGFIFGPVDALKIDPAIDSWPLNTPDLQNFIAANPAATKADVENAGDDLRGFHAIEYLLFGDGVATNDKPATALSAGELSYLIALAEAFKARTAALADSWTTDFNGRGAYAALVKSAGATGNTAYVSRQAVLEEFVDGVIGIVDEVGNAKIAEPLGTSIGAADTTKVESQYSWNSLTDFHDNIQSVLNVYTGQRGFDADANTVRATSPGLHAFVNAHDPALATRVLNEIITAQRRIALIKGDGIDRTTAITGSAQPFRAQIKSTGGRALVADAQAALRVLQTSLESEVKPLIARTVFVE